MSEKGMLISCVCEGWVSGTLLVSETERELLKRTLALHGLIE